MRAPAGRHSGMRHRPGLTVDDASNLQRQSMPCRTPLPRMRIPRRLAVPNALSALVSPAPREAGKTAFASHAAWRV